jgi:hypothetical protein
MAAMTYTWWVAPPWQNCPTTRLCPGYVSSGVYEDGWSLGAFKLEADRPVQLTSALDQEDPQSEEVQAGAPAERFEVHTGTFTETQSELDCSGLW